MDKKTIFKKDFFTRSNTDPSFMVGDSFFSLSWCLKQENETKRKKCLQQEKEIEASQRNESNRSKSFWSKQKQKLVSFQNDLEPKANCSVWIMKWGNLNLLITF